jgi:hypothetical protein
MTAGSPSSTTHLWPLLHSNLDWHVCVPMSMLQDVVDVGVVAAASGPLSSLQTEIGELKAQLKVCDEEIKDAKRQGDKAEVAALRAVQQQIGERLKLLMEKELWLLRAGNGN